MLPEVLPSSGVFGVTDPEVLGRALPITGVAGDQQAALFGQGCHSQGQAKSTYGTGCFLLMNTGREAKSSESGLLTTIAWQLGDEVSYALEGSVFVGGAVIQWMRDELGLVSDAAESEALAASVEDTNGVYLVPAFTGLGAPHWNPEARGLITGLTRGAGKAHIVRAGLESIAYQVRDLVQCFQQDAGGELSELQVDGGASGNDLLMQFQADVLGVPVLRPESLEVTAFGAAALAGLGAGVWTDKAGLASVTAEAARFSPDMSEERRQELLSGWDRAVTRASS
jgi:glycerol kinase